MLTLPKIAEREAQPYVALRRRVTIPFGEEVGATVPKLWQWLEAHRVESAGPLFFKYNLIDMPRLEIEFGVPTEAPVQPDGELVAGVLPAGRYATLTYHGHYDNLIEVTAVLIGWCNLHRYAFDSEQTPEGERFASRLELYPNNPDEVPDPADWETVLMFKLKD